MAPLTIEVRGEASISTPAERAAVFIEVRSEGLSQDVVNQDVRKMVSEVQSLLNDTTVKAQGKIADSSPITHWSNSSLSTGYYVKYDDNLSTEEAKAPTRIFTANADFQVIFRDFGRLGSCVTDFSSMPHVKISKIDWRLTDETQAGLQTRIRQMAVEDAVKKAKDYAEALGRPAPRAIEVKDIENNHSPVYAAYRGGGDTGEVEMSFNPEEVSSNCSIFVKFEEGV